MKIAPGAALLASAFALSSCNARQDAMNAAPASGPPGRDVVLPERLARAIESSDPDFGAFQWADFDTAITNSDAGWAPPFDSTGSPSTVLADLDGDGRLDAAVLQRSKRERRFVVALDRDPVPEVVQLERWPHPVAQAHEALQEFLVRAATGPIKLPDWETGDPDTTIQVPHGGVELVFWEKASTLYYYENGRFKSVTTSD